MKTHLLTKWLLTSAVFALSALTLQAQPGVSIRLPEKTRLLVDQRFDLVVEVRGIPNVTGFRVAAGAEDVTPRFQSPEKVDLDCDGTQDLVYRANLMSFLREGTVRLAATVQSAQGTVQDVRDVVVRPFAIAEKRRNIVLVIGDGMPIDMWDAARIISRSVESAPGVPGLREGVYDRLLEIDHLPVSGLVMTIAADSVIPDSAAAATAWTIGNKPFDRQLSALPDGTDCRLAGGVTEETLRFALDNPRVETLWEYMKRRYNYRTGVVSTAFITDATPAAHGSHTGHREARFEIARQYLENPLLNNRPAFDVVFGGGKEDFDPDIRMDGRDLVAEFQAKGYAFASTATELRALSAKTTQALGLFRRPNKVSRHASNVRATVNGNLEPVYDRLRLTRPASEPLADLGTWTDQPHLDLMTEKALDILAGPDGKQPFVLMVEAGLIDKQAHPNHMAGALWDVIEMDKAVGVVRRWSRVRPDADTLLVVTADHGQSMLIIGMADISDQDLYDRSSPKTFTLNPGVGEQSFRVYKDVNNNVRAGYNFNRSGSDPNTSGQEGPPAETYGNINNNMGHPDYQDADGDGYPENRQVGGKGRKRLAVGWRTGNHTGSSVPLTAEGPGAFLFTGIMDQTDLFFKMAAALGDTSDSDALLKTILQNTRYPKTPGKQ